MNSSKQTAGKAVEHVAAVEPATQPHLKSLENKSLTSLEDALSALRELSAARLEAKLSVARITGVARELRELIKVMSVYGC